MTNSEVISKATLLERIDNGWENLQNFLNSLTADQLDRYTDVVGWTVKDHLTHLMMWEDGIYGLLSKTPRWQQMKVDQALWDEMQRTQNFDTVNAAIQQQYKDKTADEVIKQFNAIHERLLPMLRALSEADLQQNIVNVQPDYKGESPLVRLIIDDTYGHFEEHLPWMQAIANGGVSNAESQSTG